MNATELLLRKAAVTFISVFLPLFLASITTVLDDIIAWAGGEEIDFNLVRAAFVSGLVAAAASAARVVVAYFTTIVPTDALHGPGSQKGQTVQVTKTT